ncbi:MAG TPA: hypothetical protein VG323_06415 [Thermoanaerobaculia bacterium]|nr:hypothetical protein [Thermoanaerobaculia bacterium]
MILLSLQTLLLVAAGLGLLRLWRAALPQERWLQFIVAAGFLTRALLGQILFWISWARLPIARSLQFGGGYWVFAMDAPFYVWKAGNVAGEGLRAIAAYDRAAASPTYVQVLAIAQGLLGAVPCVGLLLNLFCYLGAVAILVRWMRLYPRTRTAAAIAIAALSLSPGIILWSLSALKEPLFQFLFVAFVAACAAWQRAWMTSERWTRRAGIAALMIVLLYALAGLRWYFGFVLLLIASLFMLLVAVQAVGRRAAAFASAAVVAVILSQSLLASAEEYMPTTLRAVLTPATALKAVPKTPHSVVTAVEQARQGFDASPANTAIQSGSWATKKTVTAPPKREETAPAPLVAAAPPPMASASAITPPPPAAPPPPAKPAVPKIIPLMPPPPELRAELDEADAARIREFFVDQVGAWNSDDLDRYMNGYWNSPEVELRIGSKSYVGWQQIRDYVAPQRGEGTIALDGVELSAWTAEAVFARMKWTWTSADGEHKYDGESKALLRKFPDGWKIVRARIPLAADSAPPPQPAAPPAVAAATVPAPVAQAPPKPIAHKRVKAIAPKPASAPAPAAAPAPVLAPPPSFTAADEAQIRALIDAQAAAWNRNDLARYMDAYWKSPALEIDDTETVRGFQDSVDNFRMRDVRGGTLGTVQIERVHVAGLADVATASGHWFQTQRDGNTRDRNFRYHLRRFPAEGWKIVRAEFWRPTAAAVAAPRQQSRIESFLTGAAALVVPRGIGERLGVFHIGGGHGMLWFTDVDTVVFALILVVAIVALFARPGVHWRNPLTWLVLLITVLIAVPLAYSISNFGTLFRLREMIYLGLLLTPLAVASARSAPAA